MRPAILYGIPSFLTIVLLGLSGCTGRTVLHGGTKHVFSSIIEPNAEKGKKVHIWFVKVNSDQLELVPVIRSVSPVGEVQEAVEQLLKGPNNAEFNSGLASEIPKGTVLITVKHNGRNIDLNLSQRFASGGGTTSFETRLEQLKRTLSEVAGQSKVYLDVEGKRLSIAGEGLEIQQPIN